MDVFKEEKKVNELEKKIEEMKNHVEEELSDTEKRIHEDMREMEESFSTLREIVIRLNKEKSQLVHDREFLMEKHKDFLEVSKPAPKPEKNAGHVDKDIGAEENEEKENLIKSMEEIITPKTTEKKAESEKTPIDELLELIAQKGSVNMKYAAERFGVRESQIEEWARVLHDHGLIEIHYPVFGKPEMKKVS